MTLSPRFGKFVALGILVLAVWVVGTLALRLASTRMSLKAETRELKDRYQALQSRRVDIPSLEAELARLDASDVIRQAAITGDSERAALARLQQIARKAVEGAGGQLLALNETAAPREAVSSLVATQVRARLKEPALPQVLMAWESGSPSLRVNELTLVSRARAGEPPSDIEVTAIIRGRWVSQRGSSR